MEPTTTPHLTAATVIVVFCDGKSMADLIDPLDVRQVESVSGRPRYVGAEDGPLDFVVTVIATDVGTATLRITYVTHLYDPPVEWMTGNLFAAVVRSVIGLGS